MILTVGKMTSAGLPGKTGKDFIAGDASDGQRFLGLKGQQKKRDFSREGGYSD
ncbi:MAG: hypothetical protein WA639_07605 [Candidatus Acidiferrum sp.]